MATSVKLSGSLLVVYWILVLLFSETSFFINKLISRSILIVLSVGYVVFFILNPFIWHSPINRSIKMFNHRRETFHQQQISQKFSHQALLRFPERATKVYERTLSLDGDFTNLKLEKINFRYKSSLDLPILIVFFYFVVKKFFKKRRNPLNHNQKTLVETKDLIWIYLLSIFIPTLIFIPLNWDRYYLPFIFVWGYLIAFFLSKINYFFNND